jgi:TonB family protein
MAVKSVRPIYPEDALRHGKSGVVVADVHSSFEGTVTAVDILETPDPAIGASVRRALAQWRFKFADPTKDESRVDLSAKLVFYFEIQHGKGVVLYPSETGYVGHWSKRSEGPVGTDDGAS